MKSRPLPFSGRGALAAAAFLLVFAPAQFSRAQTAAVNPFTYLGRVMDSEHKAFDADRSATVSAFDAAGEKLAQTDTYFLENSRRNYKLVIPLADDETDGYATPGAILSVSVKDNEGKTWAGVVVDADRADGTAVGEPGGVREVDIVLGEDKDGDGIDDALFKRLKAEWEDSDFWNPASNFNPRVDYDGDGVSTIDEALAGTNPFNTNSVLRITAFAAVAANAADRHSLEFPTAPGRAYVVQTADSPTGTWSTVSAFLAPDAATPVNVLSRPSKGQAAPATVYLLPTFADAAFFRVKLDGDPAPAD
jgi:hypothetical protein